jgi:acetyl-CoA carboxylase biotin carboxyl carrier protein
VESKEIQDLIELVSRSNVSKFELEHDGFRIKMVKGATSAATTAPRVALSAEAPPPPAATSGAETAPAVPPPVEDGLSEMNSPIVGTFYSAPGPDSPNFVSVGSRVSKGQVMCIVEAMKVMNEIESEIDGEVVEILVKNGQPVEYGEVMFRLRPS